MMLRVSHLRKLVKPSSTCHGPTIALLGTEVGTPVSPGLTAEVIAGTVTATGAGYDFIDGVLSVSANGGYPLTSGMTFSIAGTGPVIALDVYASIGAKYIHLFGVTGQATYAAIRHPDPDWAISAVPVNVPAGAPYELKCSIADTWVGVWLNGTRIARAEVTPGYLATTLPWTVRLGGYYWYETSTGHVYSASLGPCSLPDIDVL